MSADCLLRVCLRFDTAVHRVLTAFDGHSRLRRMKDAMAGLAVGGVSFRTL